MEITKGVRRLTEATNRMDGAYYVWARRRGINENRLAILYALDGGAAVNQKQISDEWLIPKTTVNTVIRELEREGIVALTARGREKLVALTESGRAYTEALLAPMKAAEVRALQQTLERYSPEFLDAYDCFSGLLCRELQRDSEEDV